MFSHRLARLQAAIDHCDASAFAAGARYAQKCSAVEPPATPLSGKEAAAPQVEANPVFTQACIEAQAYLRALGIKTPEIKALLARVAQMEPLPQDVQAVVIAATKLYRR